MSIDENSAEIDSKEGDEYMNFIGKIEKVFVPKKSWLHARFRFNKARSEGAQVLHSMKLN